MKRCILCGYDKVQNILIELVDAAETRIMCPNCVAQAVSADAICFEADYNLVDDITGLPGAVRFRFLNDNEHYTLAPRAMLRLLAHSLRPEEWRALAEKYDEHNFMLHDDFYGDDGEAYQPTIRVHQYIWKDVVEINGKHFVECFEISGQMDGDAFQLDDFYEQVARKHDVDIDDIQTYMMDNIDFDPQALDFGAEDCGCYIDGIAEWLYDEDAADGEYDD